MVSFTFRPFYLWGLRSWLSPWSWFGSSGEEKILFLYRYRNHSSVIQSEA